MKKNLCNLIACCFLVLTAFISNSSSSQWVRKANSVKPRSDLSESIVYNSKLYTFMGFNDSKRHCDPTSEVYDPATDQWTELAPIPNNESRTHQRAILIDNTIWQIGGRIGQNPGPLTNNIWIYNISSDSWSKGPDLIDPATKKPLPWAAGGAVLLGRTLHLFGGFVYNACNNDQSTYHLTLNVDEWLANPTNPAKWANYLAPLPIKRNHFSTLVLGGKIYVMGGQFGHDCGGGQEQRFSHVYDPATDTWTELPLLPDGRSHAEGASFAAGGKIYILGGQDGEGKSTDLVTIFDPAGNNGAGSWTNDPSLTLPFKMEGGSAKVIDNSLIYTQGGEETSSNPRKKTFIRPFLYAPVYKLGFPSACLKLSTNSGSSVKGKTILFTIDGSKSYNISTNASWLSVTKNAKGVATPNAVDIEITANTAGLAPGNYSALVTATGSGDGPLYSDASYCVNLTVNGPITSSVDTLQAETASLNGVKVADNHPDFSGTGFGDFINPSGDFVEWTFNKAVAGLVTLQIRYSNGKEPDRPLRLEVNGQLISTLSFPSTGDWTNWALAQAVVNLNTGVNTIRLTATGSSGPNVDYLSYSATQPALRSVTTHATTNSDNLLKAYVSPNPTAGNTRLVLTSASNLPVEVELSDMLGKPYQKMQFSSNGSNAYNFSVANLPAGVYIVKVKQGTTIKTTKLLVGNRNLR